MKKIHDQDFEKVALDLPDGFAHGLNLLLLAIGKTNPAIATLLDEFTAMHAEYLAGLRTLTPESAERAQMLESFSQASRSIYKRLRELADDQSASLRVEREEAAVSLRLH